MSENPYDAPLTDDDVRMCVKSSVKWGVAMLAVLGCLAIRDISKLICLVVVTYFLFEGVLAVLDSIDLENFKRSMK